MFADCSLANGHDAVRVCPHSRSTYAARWKVLDLGEVLGESEAGEEDGGQNEALHGVCICTGCVDMCGR